jgi:hypothetical protein
MNHFEHLAQERVENMAESCTSLDWEHVQESSSGLVRRALWNAHKYLLKGLKSGNARLGNTRSG